jgi:hypothetical protein
VVKNDTRARTTVQAAAAHALLNLAVNKKNKAAIAAAGAIGTLVELLGRSDQSVRPGQSLRRRPPEPHAVDRGQ